MFENSGNTCHISETRKSRELKNRRIPIWYVWVTPSFQDAIPEHYWCVRQYKQVSLSSCSNTSDDTYKIGIGTDIAICRCFRVLLSGSPNRLKDSSVVLQGQASKSVKKTERLIFKGLVNELNKHAPTKKAFSSLWAHCNQQNFRTKVSEINCISPLAY